MDQLQGMRVFARVADLGSFARAANDLDMSRAMASSYVAQLEKHLGTRLLHRTTRKVTVSPEGAVYLERCKRLLAELDEANASVSDLERSLVGPITMTAPILFGQMHVAPVVTEFLAEHPGASVNLILTDRFENIVEEGIDLAVLYGTGFAFFATATDDWRFSQALCRAWNDWAAEYCAADPARLPGGGGPRCLS